MKTCKKCRHSEQKDYGIFAENIKTYCLKSCMVTGGETKDLPCFELHDPNNKPISRPGFHVQTIS